MRGYRFSIDLDATSQALAVGVSTFNAFYSNDVVALSNGRASVVR